MKTLGYDFLKDVVGVKVKEDNLCFQEKCLQHYQMTDNSIVYNQEQTLNECVKTNFIDCSNAYPAIEPRILQAPNMIFIDIDLIHSGNNYQNHVNKLNKSLRKILRNIESKLNGCKGCCTDIEGRGNQKSTTFGSDRYHHEELPFPQIRGHLMLRLVCNPLVVRGY